MAKPGGARVILGFLLFGAVQGLAQNQVLDLDGQDSYVELPNNSFSDLEEATVEGWVKFQEFRRESRFCDFGTMGTGIYVTEVETTRTLRFVVQDKADVQTPDQKAEIENALRLGSWCHLAAVTGRSGMKLYVNGVLAGTAPHTGSFQSIGRNTNAIHNYLGRNNYRGFFRTEDFRGQMDEIRVWSTARTAEEIRANLFHRLTGNEPGLAGLWNFDEGTARDRSPHQRHGILAGNAKCVAADFPSSAQAPAPAVLFGRITDANGTPLRGVAVRLEENDSPIAEAMTDDRGDYRMAVYASAATYDLSATSGRKGDWRLGLQLKAAEWCRTDFALKEAARLSGRVRTMDTNVFQAAVVVQAIRYEPSWTKPAEGSQELNAYAAETQRTDANGRFQFVNLKPGQYRLRAHGNGQLTDYDQGTPLKVELGQSQPGLDFRMPPVKKGLWQNYTLLDGIRNDDVRDLLFDRDGMLWLATWGGALRFDGVQWTQYTKEEGLSDNRVNALARDAKGNLWLATENGVSCLTNRVWRRFFKADGLADDRVRALAGAPDGSMWFGTARGASRFDGKAWQKIDPPSGLGDEDVNCILREPDGAIWFGTSNGALRYEEGRWRNVFGQHGLAPHAVYSIHRDSDGTLWFGESGSVARYDGQAFTRLTTQDGLLPGVVHSILRDSRGVLWFGANNAADLSNGGVTRWDGRSVVCLSEADGLAGSGVRSIRQTPDGAVWFATDGGVSRYDENTFRRFTTQDGLPNNAVSRLQSFSDGTLWFWRIAHGSDEYHWPETDPGDGISRYDGRSFFSFTVSDGLAGNHVQTIGRDPSGEIWITGQGGVSRFDGKRFREPIKGGEWGRDGGISLYQDPEGKMWIGRHNGVSFAEGAWVENFSTTNVLANQHVSAIHRDNDGTLWFATLNQGIWRYDGRGFTNFSTEHGLPSVRVCSIDRAGDGTLWFRTGCGFARFDRKQFSAITCTQGLTDDRVNALHIDPDGTVWAGTAGGGVNRWQDGQVTTFTATRSRLAHDKVNAIYRDAQGVLWFGTDGGVSRYNGIGWSSLDERDGLAGNRVNAIAQDASGAYWFATDKGLTRYQPDTIQPNPPRLTIGTGETATPGEPPSVLAGRLVRFEFHAADLSNRPQNRKYRFQIQPGVLAAAALSQTWQPATDASQIEWTTNKAGAYTFAVQYLDRDLRLSDPAIATLTIVPPWYLNAWIAVPSGAGVLALLSSSLVLGLRYYAKRKESLKLREAMFIQEHRAREALESKNVQLQSAKEAAERAKAEADRANRAKSLFLANMSHEIRTPMNAILGYAEILQNDPSISPKQDHALETIRKSGDHLLALIDEILDLSKIEAGKMELHLTEFDLHGWVKDVAAIFEMRSRHKQLAWCLELLGEPEPPVEASAAGNRPLHSEAATPRHPAEAWERGVWVRGDAVKLGQVLMNLLANAVKFTETGSVSLKVTARPASEFVFEVIDTGRGIPPEKHSGLFRPFGQADQSISADGAGLGLAISKQKLDLMGGTLRFESTSGQGSRFWFSLTLPASVPRVLASSMNAPKRMRRLVASCQVRALVVDDLPDNRDVLCEILSSIGCRVASASNGREAVMSVRTFRPDIVFMDIRLPDMDGFQATREIQQEFGAKACKIVSFSGSAMDHERQAYLDAGFDDFLAKPLRAEMICETLKRLLNAEFEPGNGSPDMHADATRTGALSTSASYSELIAHLKRAAEESNATKVRACLDSLEQMGSEGKRLAEPLRAELGRYDFAAMRNRILVLEARALNQPPEHEAGNQTI